MRRIISLIFKWTPFGVFAVLLIGGGWLSLVSSLDLALRSGNYTPVFWGVSMVIASFVWLGVVATVQYKRWSNQAKVRR